MSFYDQLRDVLEYPETREEIIEVYRERYPGVKTQKNGRVIEEWKGKLAADLEGMTGISRKNLMRRFQNRGNKRWEDTEPSARQEEEYKKLGETLPPIVPHGGFHIWGIVWIKYSKECVDRDIDIYVTGRDAEFLAKTAEVQVVINLYNEMPSDAQGYAECPDEESELNVEAIY